jgi:hypothetical protein|tara:strand:+ start:165 stop:437 length:273 start_codon:yes stop_codon:yes gene_type:complete
MTRKIPLISLEDFETKSKKRQVYKSLVQSISEGVEFKLESVNVAEIKNHDMIISVPKTEWKSGLENAMDYYIKKEEYEECSKIKKLIEKL